jgi:hypothetical protein
MAMCRNWRTWAVLGAAGVAVALVAPGAWATVLPLLVVAACPLSMLAMGVGMARAGRRGQDHVDVVGERDSGEELVR